VEGARSSKYVTAGSFLRPSDIDNFQQTSIKLSLRQPEGEIDLYKPVEKIALPPPKKLALFRVFVGAAKIGKIQLEEAASEYIQNDFVRERQDDKSLSADDLIIRMTIARLLALSLHEKEVTVDIWERAKAFDGRRKARVL